MILGASALGLLTRRKVRTGEGNSLEAERRRRKTAKQEAEDRIDEIHALNLLISAHAIPEAYNVDERVSIDWRNKMLKPLLNLVTRAIETDQPLNRLGIASILHFVTPDPPIIETLKQTQPLLLAQALEAYRALPPLVDPSTPESQLDNFTLSSFLSIIYPRPAKVSPSPADLAVLDRTILNTLSTRILSSPSDFPPKLLFELGKAAARAKRVDIFEEILGLSDLLSPQLQLELAVNGLDLVASQQQSRNDREKVLPLAELFTSTVEEMKTFDKEEVAQLDRGIYLLRTAFSIDQPLEPFIYRSILSTLSSDSSLLKNKKYRTLLVDVLRHLVKSRNPTLARRIISSIPSPQLRLSHLVPLLSSSHPSASQFLRCYLVPLLSSSHSSTSQSTWELLLSHSSHLLT